MEDTPPRGCGPGSSGHPPSSSPEVKEVRITRPVVPALKLPSKDAGTERSASGRSQDRSGGSAEDSQPNSARSVHSARSVTNSVSSFTTLSARSNPTSGGRTGEDSPRLRPFNARRMLELQQDADRWRTKAMKLQKQLEEGTDARSRKMDLEMKALTERMKKKDEAMEQLRQRDRKAQQRVADSDARNRELQIELHRQEKVIRDYRMQQIKQEGFTRDRQPSGRWGSSNADDGSLTQQSSQYGSGGSSSFRSATKRSSSASTRAARTAYARHEEHEEQKVHEAQRALARAREEFAAKKKELETLLQREKQENARLRNELENLKPTNRRVSFGECECCHSHASHTYPAAGERPRNVWEPQLSPRSPRATTAAVRKTPPRASPPSVLPLPTNKTLIAEEQEDTTRETQILAELRGAEQEVENLRQVIVTKFKKKKSKHSNSHHGNQQQQQDTTTSSSSTTTATPTRSALVPPLNLQLNLTQQQAPVEEQQQQQPTRSTAGKDKKQPTSSSGTSKHTRNTHNSHTSNTPTQNTTNNAPTSKTRPAFVPQLKLGASQQQSNTGFSRGNFSPPPAPPPPPYHAPSNHPASSVSSSHSEGSDGWGTNSLTSEGTAGGRP